MGKCNAEGSSHSAQARSATDARDTSTVAGMIVLENETPNLIPASAR